MPAIQQGQIQKDWGKIEGAMANFRSKFGHFLLILCIKDIFDVSNLNKCYGYRDQTLPKISFILLL